MYSQLTFSYMITDDFGEIELPSPLEQPGQKTKNLLQELEVIDMQNCFNHILTITLITGWREFHVEN